MKHPRLGSVLVEMGRLRREDVEEAIRYQVGRVLAELVLWTEGFFRFDAMEIARGDEIEVDAQDFVVADRSLASARAGAHADRARDREAGAREKVEELRGRAMKAEPSGCPWSNGYPWSSGLAEPASINAWVDQE